MTLNKLHIRHDKRPFLWHIKSLCQLLVILDAKICVFNNQPWAHLPSSWGSTHQGWQLWTSKGVFCEFNDHCIYDISALAPTSILPKTYSSGCLVGIGLLGLRKRPKIWLAPINQAIPFTWKVIPLVSDNHVIGSLRKVLTYQTKPSWMGRRLET